MVNSFGMDLGLDFERALAMAYALSRSISAMAPAGGRLPYGYRVGAGIGTLTAVDPDARGPLGEGEGTSSAIGSGVVV